MIQTIPMAKVLAFLSEYGCESLLLHSLADEKPMFLVKMHRSTKTGLDWLCPPRTKLYEVPCVYEPAQHKPSRDPCFSLRPVWPGFRGLSGRKEHFEALLEEGFFEIIDKKQLTKAAWHPDSYFRDRIKDRYNGETTMALPELRTYREELEAATHSRRPSPAV